MEGLFLKGKKNRLVLYQPICKRCHFIVKASIDVNLAKMLMEDHLEKSHGYEFTFISHVPLGDFKAFFKIMRTINPSPSYVESLRLAEQRPAFYKVQRLPKNPPLVSA